MFVFVLRRDTGKRETDYTLSKDRGIATREKVVKTEKKEKEERRSMKGQGGA